MPPIAFLLRIAALVLGVVVLVIMAIRGSFPLYPAMLAGGVIATSLAGLLNHGVT